MNKSIFKAYDIRGLYPEEINEKTASEVAAVLRRIFDKGLVVLGRDTRLSSPSLYRAMIRKLKSGKPGIKIVAAGMVTTPMFYFLVNKLKARGGIMITASHNPKEYNGFKVVGRKAKMISGKAVLKLTNG